MLCSFRVCVCVCMVTSEDIALRTFHRLGIRKLATKTALKHEIAEISDLLLQCQQCSNQLTGTLNCDIETIIDITNDREIVIRVIIFMHTYVLHCLITNSIVVVQDI